MLLYCMVDKRFGQFQVALQCNYDLLQVQFFRAAVVRWHFKTGQRCCEILTYCVLVLFPLCKESTKHLLKKRYSNVKSMNVKASKKVSQLSDSSISDVDIESQSKADLEKHEKELAKELGKKVINWKAAEQLLNLTFDNRRERVSKITGLNAVPNMLQQFPYFEHEKVVSDHSPVVPTSV